MKYLLTLAICLMGSSVLASGYPPDFFDVHAFIQKKSPALVARISSSCMGSYIVIGYANGGALRNADELKADVTPLCQNGSTIYTLSSQTFPVGKEWSGKGYLSYPLRLNLCEGNDSLKGVKINLTDSQSHLSENFVFDFSVSADSFITISHTTCSQFPISVWDFIKSNM